MNVMSLQLQTVPAALAACFTRSLIGKCHGEQSWSTTTEALQKLSHVRFSEKYQQIKIDHVPQERILICLMCFQLQCLKVKMTLIMLHVHTASAVSSTFFLRLGTCLSTFVVALLPQGIGNVLPQFSGRDSSSLQPSPGSNFASGQLIRGITLARHSL